MKLIILAVILGVVLVGSKKPPQLQLRNLYPSINGGLVDIDERIINGQLATPNSIPYQAFLRIFRSWQEFRCGGSIISANTILTAAHCVYGSSMVSVVLGAPNLQEYVSTRVEMAALKIIFHESYDPKKVGINDLALIILPQAAPLNSNIDIIKLPSKGSSDSYAGKIGKTSGWGYIHGNLLYFPDNLLYTENPILSNNECSSVVPDVKDYQVCLSGNLGNSVCHGDSGGPLVVDGVLVGVVSYGSHNCLYGYPSVFMRITSFLDWIEKHSV